MEGAILIKLFLTQGRDKRLSSYNICGNRQLLMSSLDSVQRDNVRQSYLIPNLMQNVKVIEPHQLQLKKP